MRNTTVLLAVLALILATTNLPAGKSRVRMPVSLNNVNDSSSPQNISAYSYCPDWLKGWLFFKFDHHSFRNGIISNRQMDSYYTGLFNSANRIEFEAITINAILDYDDYTHIDRFIESKN